MAKQRTNRQKWIARSKVLRANIDHCVVCFSDAKLHVHHLRYRKGGRGSDLEKPEDVVVLCQECHNALHRHKLVGPRNFLDFKEQRRTELAERVLYPAWLRLEA